MVSVALQVARPCQSLLARERLAAQTLGDPRVAFDLVDGQIAIGTEPEAADGHRVARPLLELAAMAGAVEDEEARGRKADAAAPRQRQSTMCLLDEVVEIAVPALIEVGEEDQPAAVVDE